MPGALSGGGVTARYRLFGLDIESEIRLDELESLPGFAVADVQIVCGAEGPIMGDPGAKAGDGSLVFTVPDLARYTVTEGSRIVVERAPHASPRNVKLFLLGSAFGMLLHQRGLLPLHANAVEIDRRAVAFCGPSGSGKSTLAAWFHDRGHRILADDVCVIRFAGGVAMAQAGLPRLRLWGDALSKGGRDAADFVPSFDDMDKFDVPTREVRIDALPLGAVYRLGREAAGGLQRLSGAAAVDALIANIYRGEYLKLAGGGDRHFRDCVALARAVPLFAAGRAWGFDRFDAEASLLEAHARQVLSTPA